ncbi:hypothetical protein FH972_024706 [Carpinus fangiana]|uniref:Protein BCCIP homolog n=1 Tax=Carpinus fangiana TaxID=176857 RepID=A0A5N6KYS2_9ROSI|nr:hypothetical protein FH972_024706 [Carpinus fangiana]
MLDIEFEWFDPQEVDFHGIKTLLKQLFDADHELMDCSGLSDLVISQPKLGSTVKVSDEVNTDAKNNDPFAFLTVLNLHAHLSKPPVQSLTSYLSSVASQIPSLASTLPSILSSNDAQVGLVLTERFINMPAEIVPPMYTMLLEEIQWALDENEPYKFTHYLVLSKTYTEVISKLGDGEGGTIVHEDDDDDAPKKKKQKGKKGGAATTEVTGETFYFHPEDEVLHRFAAGYGDFAYRKEAAEGASDAKRAFYEAGVKPMGHMILLEAGKFQEAVEAVKTYLGG